MSSSIKKYLAKHDGLYNLHKKIILLAKAARDKLKKRSIDLHGIRNVDTKYIFLLPFGLGDTLLTTILSTEVKKETGVDTFFLIKPEHEIIMTLLGLKNNINYAKMDIKNLDLSYYARSNKNRVLGVVYVAHPYFYTKYDSLLNKFNKGEVGFLNMYREFLSLKQSAKLIDLKKYLKVSNCATKHKKNENEVVIFPGATTLGGINPDFWAKIAHEIQENGADVTLNAMESKMPIDGVKYIKPGVDSIKKAILSKNVISLRSGICDILGSTKNNLFILYPDKISMKNYSLSSIYTENKNIWEFVMTDEDKIIKLIKEIVVKDISK